MNINPFMRLMVFLLSSVLMVVLASVVVYLIQRHGITTPKMRIATMVQDIMVFILPPIIAAIISCRLPARLLLLNKPRAITPYMLIIAVALCSIPAMNWLVAWNEALPLPEWMSISEDAAREGVQLLMGGTSVGDLLMNLLIVGVMAGLSEELFFRGGLQQLLITIPINPHVAIWISAVVFSAIHFQFFGFVPRMLLGAYFGYLAWWSGTIWLPVAAHVLNNSVVVMAQWLASRGMDTEAIDEIGTQASSAPEMAIVAASVVLTAAGILLIKKGTCKHRQEPQP